MANEMNEDQKILFWKNSVAFQIFDGHEVSEDLIQIAKNNIEGKISAEEAVAQAEKIDGENHANLVAARTFAILSLPKNEFDLSQDSLCKIHNALFEGILEDAGEFRKKEIAKKEWTLDGGILTYPAAKKISNSLEKIFSQENEFDFENLNSKKSAKHIANFISELWQIHPFEKFNTQTIATFFIKYLEHFGFEISNETLAQNPVYFRNALVRSAYSDKNKKIRANAKFLEMFIENLIFDGKNNLNYKATHFDKYGVVLKDSPKKIPHEKKPSEKKQKKAAAPKNQEALRTDQKEETPFVPSNPKVARLCKNAQIECNEKIEKILEYLFENKSITNSQARTVAETSTETARKILASLSEKEIVEAQGANRNRVYLFLNFKQ